jgi:uncharacterized protein YukE
MSQLIVSSSSVADFARELRRYASELEGSTVRMNGQLSRLGSDWKDAKYRAFKGEMESLARDIKKTRQRVDSYSKHLTTFAQRVREAERTKIG